MRIQERDYHKTHVRSIYFTTWYVLPTLRISGKNKKPINIIDVYSSILYFFLDMYI